MNWSEEMRNLWVERMVWTRHYIISLMMRLRDLSFVAERALRNGNEIASLLSQFYGVEIYTQLENILTQHLLLLAELTSTLKSNQDIDPMLRDWDKNRSDILELLLRINPYLEREELEALLDEQFGIEMDLIQNLIIDQYSQGIAGFDLAHDNALKIARILTEAIQKQFGLNGAQ